MARFDRDIIREVQDLENVVFVCFGRPEGDDLPQVCTSDDVVVDLICDTTGKTMKLVDAEIHHQTDPSYERGGRYE